MHFLKTETERYVRFSLPEYLVLRLRVRGLEESHGRANEGVWPASSPANNKARSVWSYVATGESTGKIKSQLQRNINNQLIPC